MENIPSNIKQKKSILNKYWLDPNYKLQIDGREFTLREVYNREVENNQKVFEYIKQITDESVPAGKFILFVNETKQSPLDKKDFEFIDDDRKRLMYRADTGTDYVPTDELLDRNVERCLGFEHKDDRFKVFKVFTEDIESLPFDERCVGVVFSGSEMNMLDTDKEHLAYLDKAQKILKKVKERNTPILGICFGAQMIACSAGATIKWLENANGEKIRTIGNKTIHLENQESVQGDTDMPVIQNHGQSIDSLTLTDTGAKILATSEYGNAEIYRIGDSTLGTQFHPEISTLKVDIVSSLNGDTIDPRETFARDVSETRKKIFEFFLLRVKEYNKTN